MQFQTRKEYFRDKIITSLSGEHFFKSPVVFLNSYKQYHSSYEDMKTIGFLPKQRKKDPWDKADITKLKVALEEIASNKVQIVQKDHYYYISHYIFHDTKSPTQIEWMVNQQIRRILDE